MGAYQTAYFDQARGLAKTDAERAALTDRSPRIEQYIVTSFGDTRVDRCDTCHIAIDDPRFEKYAQPLKAHSYSAAMGDVQTNGKWERKHKFADFGCTVCHDGQGRGLDREVQPRRGRVSGPIPSSATSRSRTGARSIASSEGQGVH